MQSQASRNGVLPRWFAAPLAAAAAGLLAGCAGLRGTPAPAAPDVPPSYAHRVPANGSPVELARWWEGFGDPALPRLIAAALAHSPGVEQALARRDQARAAAGIAAAAAAPTLNASFKPSRSSTPTILGTSIAAVPVTTITPGLDASWEIDLFGRIAHARAAARAELAAADYAVHGARVAVAADVARYYVQARGCRAQLVRLRELLRSGDETLRIETALVQAGRLAPNEISHVRATHGEMELRVHAQVARCAAADAGLRELSGLPPAALGAELDHAPAVVPRFTGHPGEGVPADLLRQRPDIAASERAVAAALARLDASRADRWPSLSLTGSLSRQRISTSGVDISLTGWSLASSLVAPLLDGGLRAARVDQGEAAARAALAEWRQAVLRAVSETESTLGQLDAALKQQPVQAEVVAQYRVALAAEEARRKVGRTTVLDVEQARRNAFEAEARALDAEESLATLWITLYRNLGGHWGAPAS